MTLRSALSNTASLLVCACMVTPAFAAAPAAMKQEAAANVDAHAKQVQVMVDTVFSYGEPGFQVTYENMVKRPSNICQFFLALNPDGFAGSEAYGVRMTHIAEKVTTAKSMPGAEPPRLPGSRGHAVKRKAAAEGIAMFDNLRAALKNVAGMIESPPA